MQSMCLITGDAYFDHLVKVASARFHPCKVTVLLFKISKHLIRVSFETM